MSNEDSGSQQGQGQEQEQGQGSVQNGTTSHSVEDGKVRPLTASCPRIIRRNMGFNQSRNSVYVRQKNAILKMLTLLQHDWFHAFLRVATWKSLTLLLSFWTLMIIVFAGIYMVVDRQQPELSCGLGAAGVPIDFGASFAFSLETCTTVGYTLPNASNAFFEDCLALQITIYFQMVWSMMFNAFLFAFFYTRLAKCDSRGAQVVLSNKAIVSLVNNQLRFQVRVYDIDAASPVVEAHVRLYGVTKSRPVPRPLRLIQPDDEMGANLFLSLPSVVSHHVDLYSIMHPPRETPVATGGVLLRQADSVSCVREEFVCPVCGESYGNYERWSKHIKYARLVETQEDYPIEGSHRELKAELFEPAEPTVFTPTTDVDELREYFDQEISEIICVVEAIEPISSGTFSALHSYRIEDIVFHPGASFTPCIEAVKTDRDEYLQVDLDRFHGIEINKETIKVVPDRGQRRAPQRSLRPHDSFFSTAVRRMRKSSSRSRLVEATPSVGEELEWWDRIDQSRSKPDAAAPAPAREEPVLGNGGVDHDG